ncbi:palmitoyltransferase ZDHHC5-like isoform X2 [Acipenser ruthenus]|nr:palmitoyltransferase ZDHHC5-like isoform X2 [Acipenser ruthenus]
MPPGSGSNATLSKIKPSKYVPVSAATAFLVGSSSLFFVFTSPWLAQHFSLAVPLYNAIVFLFVVANFSMATFMDPGVFPRAEEDEDKEDDFRAPLYKTVEIKGIQVRMKWCSTCRFYRPPRCSHCSVCDNCVEEFDHHCPWVNNCIGRRNYRYFFLFLLSLTVHIIGVFGFGLLFILYHSEQLGKVHCAVTMAVMCVAGLFFIPVAGLTGFHLVLVARGRTTNEQVTGKFRGGVNPFTNGCWKNISHVLCSSQAPRYLGRPRKEQTVVVKPPFLRPDHCDGRTPLKVLDNGIQGELSHSTSKGSLEVMESQSADAEAPPPPKPELHRFTGLRAQLTVNTTEESSLLSPDNPATPTMYKYRPAYSSPGKNHSSKMSRGDSLREPPSLLESSQQTSYHSEPSLDGLSGPQPVHEAGGRLSGGSLSSSLRSAHTHPLGGGPSFDGGALTSVRSEGTTSTSYKSLANQTPRNGSLSYDSLPTPSESPEFESAAPEPPPGPGYSSPFLSAQIAQQREAELQHCKPGFSLPSHRDGLRRTPSSRGYEIEERDRLLSGPHPHQRAPPPRFGRPVPLSSSPPGGEGGPPHHHPPQQQQHSMRARSLGSPEKGYHHPSQFHPHLHQYPPPHGALGKSTSYTSGPGAPAMREGGVEFQQRHHGYPSFSNLIHAPK